jgi:integrase
MPTLEPVSAVVPVTTSSGLLPVRKLPPDRNPAAVYLASLSPGSRRTMKHSLDTIATLLTGGNAKASTLDWSAVRYQHATAIRSSLAERYAPATTNTMLAALRRVLKECWRLGQMTAEDYHRAVDVAIVKGETLPRGRALSSGELRALFEACADGTKAGVRDAALLAALYAGGLRRSEAAGLDLSDYSPDTGALTVRSGKGRKDRIVYAANGSVDALSDWLAIRGAEPGPLFVPVNKGDRVVPRRMSDQSVLYICRRRAAKAGVARFSPHDLRRTFVSDLLDARADLSTTKRLAGHASDTTTGRYDRRREEAKRRAAALLHVPYQTQSTTLATGRQPGEVADSSRGLRDDTTDPASTRLPCGHSVGDNR